MDYDFGIIGGGLVGSLAALLLAKKGFRVVLMDPQQPQDPQKIPDLRVSALTPYSWQLLEDAGVTAKLDVTRYSKILSMQIFEQTEAPLNFYASEVGRDRLGVIIENSVLLQAIQTCFSDNVEQLASSCENITRLEQGFLLNQKYQVQFLILAQGGNTNITDQFNIPLEVLDYQEEALVFHVASELPHGYVAYQRFMPKPLAFLPLYQNNWSSIVWTLERQQAKTLKALNPKQLAQKLEQAFPNLGHLDIISTVASFPLYAQRAKKVAGKQFILLGDSAHIVHPLAGQGVNLGFRDVAAFCQVLTHIESRNQTLDEPTIADLYTRATLKYNQNMSYGFSLIHLLYTPTFLTKLRNFGTEQLGRLPLIKKEFTKIAMGERFTPS